MNYYLDTEFHEYHKQQSVLGIKVGKPIPTIDLISIGIVSEDIEDKAICTHMHTPSYRTPNLGREDTVYPPKYEQEYATKSREYYAICKEFNVEDAWNSFQMEDELVSKSSIQGEIIGTEKTKKVYWLRENVLKPIFEELVTKAAGAEWKANQVSCTTGYNPPIEFNIKNFKKLLNKYGKTKAKIAEDIKEFCMPTIKLEMVLDSKFYNTEESYKDAEKRLEKGETVVMTEHSSGEMINPTFYAYFADYDWVVFAQLFGKMIDLPKGFPMYCNDLKQSFEDLAASKPKKEVGPKLYLHYKDWLKSDKNYPKQDPNKKHNALDDARWDKQFHEFILKQK